MRYCHFNTVVFPSILIQLENGTMNFIFISSSDTNLLRKKSVKQKIKKTMALMIDPFSQGSTVEFAMVGVYFHYISYTLSLHASGLGIRLYDGPDLKLFILVGIRALYSVAWSTGAQLMIFFCFRFPVVLFCSPGICNCHATHCIC